MEKPSPCDAGMLGVVDPDRIASGAGAPSAKHAAANRGGAVAAPPPGLLSATVTLRLPEDRSWHEAARCIEVNADSKDEERDGQDDDGGADLRHPVAGGTACPVAGECPLPSLLDDDGPREAGGQAASPEEALAREVGRNAHEYLEECFCTEVSVLDRDKFDAIPEVVKADFSILVRRCDARLLGLRHVY